MDTDPRLFVAAAVAVIGFLGWFIAAAARLGWFRTSLRCEECHSPVTVRDDTDRAAWARCEAAGVVRCTQQAPKPPRLLDVNCSHVGCWQPVALDIAGWPLCAEHAAAIRNRRPYDQERSAS